MSLLSSLKRRWMRLWNPPGFQPVFFAMESLHLTRAYYVAAELGIADLLRQRPRDVAQLATATGTDPDSLFRILRAPGGFRRFRPGPPRPIPPHTPCPGIAERHARFVAILGADERPPRTVAGLRPHARGGEDRNPGISTRPRHELLRISGRPPRHARSFFLGPRLLDRMAIAEIVKAFDFGRFRTIMDVGGGSGSLIAHILLAHPRLHGILFDRPETLQLAEARFASAGLAERCRPVAGNFLDALPRGADACIIKNTLCDWNDEGAATPATQLSRGAGTGRNLVARRCRRRSA